MKKLATIAAILSLFAFAPGCALNAQPDQQQQEEGDPTVATTASAATVSSDADIKLKLAELLKGANFTSESDFGYVVLEGAGGKRVSRLSASIVRQRLGAAVKAASEDHRDIGPRKVRSESIGSVLETIASNEADAADDTLDADQRKSGRATADALKFMKANLRGTLGFTFGTNESGDGDGEGNVLFIYVGVSKTTGKLIAIMTEAVFT